MKYPYFQFFVLCAYSFNIGAVMIMGVLMWPESFLSVLLISSVSSLAATKLMELYWQWKKEVAEVFIQKETEAWIGN